MSENNPLDNSEVPVKENAKNAIGGLYNNMKQAEDMKLYLENLKLMTDMYTNVAYKDKLLPVTVGKNGEQA